MTIHTSYFASQKITPEHAVIRISIGHPRWKLPYQVAGKLPALMPDRAWFELEKAEYEKFYLARLDALDPEAVATEIVDISGTRPAVLCCFEKPIEGEFYCHRQLLAAWFESKTGRKVEEL